MHPDQGPWRQGREERDKRAEREGREGHREEGDRRGRGERDLSTPNVEVTVDMTCSACIISSRTEASTASYPPAGVQGVDDPDAEAPSALSSSALLPAFHCLMPASEPTLAASAPGVESAGAGSFFSHFLMRFRGDRWLISAEAASVVIAGGFLPLTVPLGVPGTLSMPAPADLVCLPPRVSRESDSAHAY